MSVMWVVTDIANTECLEEDTSVVGVAASLEAGKRLAEEYAEEHSDSLDGEWLDIQTRGSDSLHHSRRNWFSEEWGDSGVLMVWPHEVVE